MRVVNEAKTALCLSPSFPLSLPPSPAGKGRRMARGGRPSGATNKVFDQEAFPLDSEDGKTVAKAEEPYYHTLESSVQKETRPPSEPFYSTPFSAGKKK